MHLFSLIVAALATTGQALKTHPKDNDLIVKTTSGRIHGIVDPDLPNIRQFLQIPYAKPPIGDLRFAPPAKLHQPNKNIDASKLPPSCIQYQTTSNDSFGMYDVPQFYLQGKRVTGDISEDCLYVAIWAPRDNKPKQEAAKGKDKGLPVLIFSTGGGYQIGGIDIPYQIPAQWVNRTPDHIVVSINYRVNIFGFPNAKGLEQNNLVNLDHRAVIEWCQENIAAFGGDPKRMVLWGQSAGAATADQYTFDYPDDPIITGVISDSGTAVGCFPTPDDKAKKNFTYVASHVGCAGLGNKPAEELACMRKVPALKINNFIANYSDNDPNPTLSFRPVIDNKLVFSSYRGRKQAKIPEIQGTNRNEGRAFAPFNPAGVNDTVALYLTLSNIVCPATVTSKNRQDAGLITYRYNYAGNWSNVSPLRWLGAYHSSELPMLMGTHPNYRGNSTPLEYATSDAFQDAYLAFVKDPVNGLNKTGWHPYTKLGENTVRVFGDKVPAQDGNLRFFESLCNGTQPTFTVDPKDLQ